MGGSDLSGLVQRDSSLLHLPQQGLMAAVGTVLPIRVMLHVLFVVDDRMELGRGGAIKELPCSFNVICVNTHMYDPIKDAIMDVSVNI